jgi:hypothetical protein
MDDFKKSEDYLLQSIEIRKKLFGDYNDELISSELAYGKLFLKQGKWENAISILDSVFKKQSKLVMDNFQWLNENQKEEFYGGSASYIANMIDQHDQSQELHQAVSSFVRYGGQVGAFVCRHLVVLSVHQCRRFGWRCGVLRPNHMNDQNDR